MSKIFVQIAAYSDPELTSTIENCLSQAAEPENLTFGICWQHRPEENLRVNSRGDSRFRIIDIPYQESGGVCWARAQTQRLYNGEEFTLQIDSHHRFVDRWDAKLKDLMSMAESSKPALSSFGTSYDKNLNSVYDRSMPYHIAIGKFNNRPFPTLNINIVNASQEKPKKSAFFVAHFLFTIGEFCLECPYDPNIYFYGEEQSLSVRAFTHGYDFFQPNEIITYHKYSRQSRLGEKCKDRDKTEKSYAYLDKFFESKGEIEKYGVGKERSFEDFENYSGVSFSERLLHPRTLKNEFPVATEDWIDNAAKVTIKVKEFALEDPDYFFGIHDARGQLLHQEIIPRKELADCGMDGYFILRLTLLEDIRIFSFAFLRRDNNVWEPHIIKIVERAADGVYEELE